MNGFEALMRMAEDPSLRLSRRAMPQVIFGFNGVREVMVLSVRHQSDMQWRNCALLLEDLTANDWGAPDWDGIKRWISGGSEKQEPEPCPFCGHSWRPSCNRCAGRMTAEHVKR